MNVVLSAYPTPRKIILPPDAMLAVPVPRASWAAIKRSPPSLTSILPKKSLPVSFILKLASSIVISPEKVLSVERILTMPSSTSKSPEILLPSLYIEKVPSPVFVIPVAPVIATSPLMVNLSHPEIVMDEGATFPAISISIFPSPASNVTLSKVSKVLPSPHPSPPFQVKSAARMRRAQLFLSLKIF